MENGKKELAQKNPVVDMIRQATKQLGLALPAHMNPERLVRIALTTLRLNPKLYQCKPESVLGALFQSAQLGLEPNIEGQSYIIPYNSKSGMVAQFQIGYKGYIELFYRHQKSQTLVMERVCKNDTFRYQLGTDPLIEHVPAMGERGDVIAYYSVAKMEGGAYAFKVMSREDCMAWGRKYSQCWDKKKNCFIPGTPWASNSDAMCLKTTMKQLMKIIPKSIELQKAEAMDGTVKTQLDVDMINIPNEIEYTPDPENVVDLTVQAVDEAPEETTAPDQSDETQAQQASAPKTNGKKNSYKDMLTAFSEQKNRLGDERYYEILGGVGYERANQIVTVSEGEKILAEMRSVESREPGEDG